MSQFGWYIHGNVECKWNVKMCSANHVVQPFRKFVSLADFVLLNKILVFHLFDTTQSPLYPEKAIKPKGISQTNGWCDLTICWKAWKSHSWHLHDLWPRSNWWLICVSNLPGKTKLDNCCSDQNKPEPGLNPNRTVSNQSQSSPKWDQSGDSPRENYKIKTTKLLTNSNMTTNKHIHLLPNKQSKLSWSRWTRANWQQPLCCDDMPLWHRLTAIVGLCRPWWWWRWRWWWWRVKATVSLRCYSPVISTAGNRRQALR